MCSNTWPAPTIIRRALGSLMSPRLLMNRSILENTGKLGWNSRVCRQYMGQ